MLKILFLSGCRDRHNVKMDYTEFKQKKAYETPVIQHSLIAKLFLLVSVFS